MISLQFKSPCPIAVALALMLGACHDSPDSPATEVVAAVDPDLDPDVVALLEQVISAPGVDLWLGDESAGLEREQMIDKFPLHAIDHERFAVSSEHLRQLRAQRHRVIAALRPRIEEAGAAALAVPGNDASVPSLEAELAIALDLNAVELLGLLTGMAMQLQTFLHHFETGKLDTYLATSHARLHRNVLGAMSGILKQEAFEPVLNEAWESNFTFDKAHADGAINLLDEGTFDDHSTPEIPVGGLAPFTTSFGQRLIDWSQQFLQQTPEQNRKGASGMETPIPVLR